MGSILVGAVIDIGGLVLIWFILRARIAKALEIDGLLAEARKEARLLTIEINETTDRNITLVEDRLTALRELLAEADRRIGVVRRETGRRQAETDVYSRLGRRPPVRAELFPGEGGRFGEGPDFAASVEPDASPPSPEPTVVPLAFGEGRAPTRDGQDLYEGEEESHPGRDAATAASRAEAVPLPLAPRLPEIVTASASVIPPKSLRERALELHRSGFSPDIIAARLGATVSEIELLVSLEEGRAGRAELGDA